VWDNDLLPQGACCEDMENAVLWDVGPRNLIHIHQRFGVTFRLNRQGRLAAREETLGDRGTGN
jgi:hypothetical protein